MKKTFFLNFLFLSLIVFMMGSCSDNSKRGETRTDSTIADSITQTETNNIESVSEDLLCEETIFEETMFEETMFEETMFEETMFEETMFEDDNNNSNNTFPGVPPIRFEGTVHHDLGVILSMIDHDDEYVRKNIREYAKQMEYGYYIPFYSKFEIIEMKNVLETTGFPILKNPSKCQHSKMEYHPDYYPEKTRFLYTVDGISYSFYFMYSDYRSDLSVLENYYINKVLSFNGSDVLVCSSFESDKPHTANSYYGEYVKDGIKIIIKVYDCKDINDINLEQFEWVYDVSEVQRFDGLEIGLKE